MARIRSVKPEIHQDEEVGVLTDSAFRLFIGLITLADDYGRQKGGIRLLAAQVWPYRPEMVGEIEGLLAELDDADLIYRYEVDGKPYVGLASWNEHQRIDNAGKPRVPEPKTEGRGSSPRDSESRGGSRLDQGGDQGAGTKEQGGDDAAKSAASADSCQSVIAKLEEVSFAHGVSSPDPLAVSKLCEEFAVLDLPAQAAKFNHYWTGPASKQALTRGDSVWAFRVWLENDRPAEPAITKAPSKKRDYSAYDAVMEPAR